MAANGWVVRTAPADLGFLLLVGNHKSFRQGCANFGSMASSCVMEMVILVVYSNLVRKATHLIRSKNV